MATRPCHPWEKARFDYRPFFGGGEIIEYLLYIANYEFLLMRTNVKAFSWAFAKHSGIDKSFNTEFGHGDHWWFLFLKKHPELTLGELMPFNIVVLKL